MTSFPRKVRGLHELRGFCLKQGIYHYSNVIHNCPEEYGMEDKGWPLTNDELAKAAEVSGVLDVTDGYIDEDFQRECATHLDDVLSIQAKDAEENTEN